MSLFGSLKGSWYLGKGSKAFKEGRYDHALKYFLSSLEYARSESDGELAFNKEVIAETYLKLGNYNKARLYASESLETYKSICSESKGNIFIDAINRVNRLIDKIAYKEKEASK